MAGKFLNLLNNHRALLVILISGAILRWINLIGSMSFFYDQARDALIATNLFHGRFVLVGPSADTSGLFMGPLWYYFLSPLYFITGGHPALVLWLISFFDLATIILFYHLGKTLFNKRVGLIAATMWAFGAVSVAYARTLSNPSTSAFWSLLIFLSLIKIFQGKIQYLFVGAISLAILFQFNLATAYLITPYVIISLFYLRNKLTNKKIIFTSLAIFLASFSPQIAFEIRNHFPSIVHLRSLFLASGPKEGFGHGIYLRSENWQDELSNYLFFQHKTISTLSLFLATAGFYLKNRSPQSKILLFWLAFPLITYFFFYFRGEAHPHYLLGWIPVAILLIANLINLIAVKFNPSAITILSIFIFLAIPGLKGEIFLKRHIAQPADPNLISLGDQIKVVDYLYQNSAGQPFGYHNYGILPYFEDKEWQYLFSWYGKKTYGYIPSRREGNPLFLIYEPDPFLPEFEKHWLKDFHSPDKGPVIAKKKIGFYTIEKFDKKLINTQ